MVVSIHIFKVFIGGCDAPVSGNLHNKTRHVASSVGKPRVKNGLLTCPKEL